MRKGLIREMGEELMKSDGTAVLESLDIKSLGYPLACGFNYDRWQHMAEWQAGTAWYGYRHQLNENQYNAIQSHADMMKHDPSYAAKVRTMSGNEIDTVRLLDLNEMIKDAEKGKIRMGYDYELEYAKAALDIIQQERNEWKNKIRRQDSSRKR